jgi:pimeloyl-ACP methyl ester carboxylesterase
MTPASGKVSRVKVGDQCMSLRHWPGIGPPLILIHGIGSTGASWETVAPALAGVVTPIALDLRGHGDSGKPDGGYLYEDYIGDLDGVLHALGIERPLLMGHSLGGIVALWWAAKHPDRAAGIVVADSPLRSGQDFAPAFDGWLTRNAMPVADLAAWYLERNPDWPPERAQTRAEVSTAWPRSRTSRPQSCWCGATRKPGAWSCPPTPTAWRTGCPTRAWRGFPARAMPCTGRTRPSLRPWPCPSWPRQLGTGDWNFGFTRWR